MYFIYLARCSDGTLYTGYTNDLKRREEVHNAGKGGAYTRGRLPIKMVYSEKFKTRSAAMKREWAIKQLSREQKEKLVSSS